jgi:hypothetical protein
MPSEPISVRPLSHCGQLHDLLRGADVVVHRGHRHEHQADGEQHLVQVRLVVQRPVQRALQHRAQQRRADEGERQADQEGHARRCISSTVM